MSYLPAFAAVDRGDKPLLHVNDRFVFRVYSCAFTLDICTHIIIHINVYIEYNNFVNIVGVCVGNYKKPA